MAQQTQVHYIDDLDGTELGDDANVMAFSFDGKDYEIDLGDDNAEAFREALAPYIDAGRKVTVANRKQPRKSPSKTSSKDTKAIREWAKENGHNVSDRGRIPADVMAAYHEAN